MQWPNHSDQSARGTAFGLAGFLAAGVVPNRGTGPAPCVVQRKGSLTGLGVRDASLAGSADGGLGIEWKLVWVAESESTARVA